METLFYMLEHLYNMTSIPSRCIDQTGRAVFVRGYSSHSDPASYEPLIDRILQHISVEETKAFIEIDEEIYLYPVFIDVSGYIIMFGPLTVNGIYFEKIYAYALARGIELARSIARQNSLSSVISMVATLHMLRYNEMLDEASLFPVSDEDMQTFLIKNKTIQLIQMEQENSGFAYDLERKYFQQIRNGTQETLHSQSPSQLNPNLVGKLAKHPLKQFEYMICSAIALTTRAAIDGGLEPSTAYAMSDMYLQRLEGCKNIPEMIKLQGEMKVHFTQQVHTTRIKRYETSYVEKCKVFIEQHLNTPFSLDDVADAININKSYLSRLFTSEEGITIMQYARNKRIEAGANMLKYSDESIAAISEYLCFPSQSHFGKVFKDIMRMTPQKYRALYQTVKLKPKLASQ